MLDFDKYKYKRTEPDPECPKQPKPPIHKDPELYRVYADQLEEYNKKKKIHDDRWKIIIEEGKKLEEQFYPDLLEDLGIEANPKAGKLFEIAWSMGHANGLSCVYEYAAQMVELIK